MKQILNLFCWIVLLIQSYNLQAQNDKFLKLYAILGSQYNKSDYTFNTDFNPEIYSFSIGAGSSMNFGRINVGTEFYNSSGNNSNNLYKIQYNGFNSTLYVGYNVFNNNLLSLEPSLGFSMSNNQLIVYNKQNIVSTVYHNNQYGITPALTLMKFNTKGVSYGIKVGYNYSLSEDNWLTSINDQETNYGERVNSFFIQLNIGGRIILSERKKKVKTEIILNQQKLPTMEQDMIKETILITNNDTDLSTTIYPKKDTETVILLHGGPGVPDDMIEVANILKEKFQVITFEQRGVGLSKCNKCDYTMQDYISDIDTIADYFDLKSFHLFGHSWGGLYAQIYAEESPEKIKSLFLSSPSSGTNKAWKLTEREVMEFNKKIATKGEWMKMGWNSLLGMFGNDKAHRKLFKQVLKNYHKDYNGIETQDKLLEKIYSKSINKTRKAIIKYKALSVVENPNFPIEITYGSDDIYGESKKELIKRFPTAEVKIIENSGHIPWKHNPKEFRDILIKFYKL